MKRWYDIVLRFPLGIGIKDQMSLLADVPDQLRVLRDVFATKAPLTLIKRANSLQRYINFLDGQGMLFPGDEDALYRHFCLERVREPFESFAISCGGIEVYRACTGSVTTQR